MIRRIRAWWRVCRGLAAVSCQIDSLRLAVAELHKQKRKSEKTLDGIISGLQKTRTDLERKLENAEAELEQARSLNKKLDAALQTTLEALEAKENIVIPGLVAANRTLMARWEAETAVMAMRKVSVEQPRD